MHVINMSKIRQSHREYDEGMMWHKAWAQPSQSGADWPHLLGRPARCWRLCKLRFANVSRKVGAWGIQCPKLVRP
jgi:hypothetical protein